MMTAGTATARLQRRARLLGATVALLFAITGLGAPPAHAAQRWPGRTITYYNTIPAYRWSINTAVRAWNTSGIGVKFVPATSRAAAQVEIVAVAWGNDATKGYTPGWKGRVSLVGPKNLPRDQGRHDVARIAAHELGHVLGLGHVSRAEHCSIMTTGSLSWGCNVPKGMWRCRILEPMDVRAGVRLYGGSVEPVRTPANCYVYKVPAPATEMSAKIGPPHPDVANDFTDNLTVTWRNPPSKGLATYVVTQRKGQCATGPRDRNAQVLGTETREFRRSYNPEGDPVPGAVQHLYADAPGAAGRYCYRVWVADLAGRFNSRPATAWATVAERSEF